MGCCTVGSKEFSADNQTQCLRGATGAYDTAVYSSASCGGAICCVHHLANYLDEKLPGDDVTVYSTWGSLDLMYDLRDLVLEQSETGKYALDLYRQHIERASEIMERDPEMLYGAMRLMLLWARFARGVLFEVLGHRPRSIDFDKSVDPELLDETLEWLRGFREQAAEQGMDDAIDLCEDLLNRARDLTPPQVWEMLQEPPQAAVRGG